MEEIITPSSTAATADEIELESVDTDLLYNLLIQHRIPPIVAQRFKNEMMDGYVLSKLQTIPVQLIPEIGVQIKFHEFFKKLTGRDLDYPAGYRGTIYEPIAEEQTEAVIRRRPPSQQINYVTPENKIKVPYPAPLPQFSPAVAHYNHTNDCIKYIHLTIRELVDYFIQNNYDLNDRAASRKICQTVLDSFPVLNDHIIDILTIEARIRHRNNGQRPWNFLSKKFNQRRTYVKYKKAKTIINSQPEILLQPNKVEEEEELRKVDEPIELNELDRLENVLAQHQEVDEVDYNNNNVDNQYVFQDFIVNQQEQQESNFQNDDLLRHLADLADEQVRNEFGELIEAGVQQENDENKENVPQTLFFSTPTKKPKLLLKTSRSSLNILTEKQQSTVRSSKRSASNNDFGEVTEKRLRSRD